MTITHVFGDPATEIAYDEYPDSFGTMYNDFWFCGIRVHSFSDLGVPLSWITYDDTVIPSVIRINPTDVTSVGTHNVEELITLANYSAAQLAINWTIIVDCPIGPLWLTGTPPSTTSFTHDFMTGPQTVAMTVLTEETNGAC